MIDLAQSLDADAVGADEFLAQVQGNILKGHGRDYVAQVFVQFFSASLARGWIGLFAENHVVSAAEQARQAMTYRGQGGAGEPFASLLLSAAGYRALEIEAAMPDDPLFAAGLKQHNSVSGDPINDPPLSAWEVPYQEDFHALALLADDDINRLERDLSDVLGSLATLGANTHVERGSRLRFDFGQPRGVLDIEHFGHQDGVSNPIMLRSDIALETASRGNRFWDPSAPLALAFVAEKSTGGHGSYMVARKLEQNVQAFRASRTQLAGLIEVDEDTAAGLMIGRRRDGTPMVPTSSPDPNADPNDFDFAGDRPPEGGVARQCPLHAHIRRTNPRGDVVHYLNQSLEFERSMRIVRRGITYGKRPDLEAVGTAPPSGGVGLLFMCFQSNLRQFAIQQSGSDADSFPFMDAGLESVIGQPGDPNAVVPQRWPYVDAVDPGATRPLAMMNFVKMLGGEYFFAPSLPFLLDLRAR